MVVAGMTARFIKGGELGVVPCFKSLEMARAAKIGRADEGWGR